MQKPKGTKDIFGQDAKFRIFVEDVIKEVLSKYNYEYIETPIFESTEVFVRSVGEGTDIVNKEMYTFKDKGDRSITLRPEGTAGTMRALVENKLIDPNSNSLKKFFYYGPMFRYERPQKGRQRQFTQFGVEALGKKDPKVDLDIILLASTILDILGIKNKLLINSLGSKAIQEKYKKVLHAFFTKHKSKLSEDSLNRLDNNVLRILDSKDESDKALVKACPKISDCYDKETKEYFNVIQKMLTKLGVDFKIEPNLVRGLDYYTDTIFEFVIDSETAGAQSTVIGGGRYEGLLESFGGPKVSGIGFGLGFERLILEAMEVKENMDQVQRMHELDFYVGSLTPEAEFVSQAISYMLRRAGYSTEFAIKSSKINKIFSTHEKLNSRYLILIGKEDMAKNQVTLKYDNKEEHIHLDKLIDRIDEIEEI